MILQHLDFERPIIDLENRLDQLHRIDDGTDKSVREEAAKLEKKITKIRKEVFANLTRWQITQLARHPNRPYFYDYINLILKNFIEIHGDRAFSDDPPIICGFAELEGQKVVVIGQQKGRNTKEKIHHNFGMANPEGYRKALRVMKLAEKFSLPVLTFIDTPGAFPGIGAEERGQSEAIARNLFEMSHLKTPIVVTVLGEGGSGGALALGVGDEILMMEYAIYSVISPEGCASILWRDTAKAEVAADMMKITAPDLKKFRVIDR
ncbi:MAG: acetyl-CoA carboxylase carboxyltransferase subunit alpha, partial [Syntrophorhabdaceae bacterium]|nr:acetyl-CoA carboxylase carboxyltransferase subunit alpha [Syntrophorhabdaceae bacterium]